MFMVSVHLPQAAGRGELHSHKKDKSQPGNVQNNCFHLKSKGGFGPCAVIACYKGGVIQNRSIRAVEEKQSFTCL